MLVKDLLDMTEQESRALANLNSLLEKIVVQVRFVVPLFKLDELSASNLKSKLSTETASIEYLFTPFIIPTSVEQYGYYKQFLDILNREQQINQDDQYLPLSFISIDSKIIYKGADIDVQTIDRRSKLYELVQHYTMFTDLFNLLVEILRLEALELIEPKYRIIPRKLILQSSEIQEKFIELLKQNMSQRAIQKKAIPKQKQYVASITVYPLNLLKRIAEIRSPQLNDGQLKQLFSQYVKHLREQLSLVYKHHENYFDKKFYETLSKIVSIPETEIDKWFLIDQKLFLAWTFKQRSQ